MPNRIELTVAELKSKYPKIKTDTIGMVEGVATCIVWDEITAKAGLPFTRMDAKLLFDFYRQLYALEW